MEKPARVPAPGAARRANQADAATPRTGRDYRRLFETLPLALFQATAEGQILDANPAAVAMFRYPDLESLLAVSAFDLHVNPGDRHDLMKRLETEGHVIDFESLMRRADGSEFWFSRVVHAISEADGHLAVWETIGRDLTERKQAQLSLALSEERLRSLLAGAPVAVATLDMDGRFTFAGGSAFSLMGFDPASLVGHVAGERFRDLPEVVDVLARAATEDLQTDLVFGDRTIHLRCGPYRPTPGAPTEGVLAIGFDNTERVEADRALRESEEVFRVLFEQSAAGISLHELGPGQSAGETHRNRRMREILGLPEEPAQPTPSLVLSTHDREVATEAYSPLLSGEIDEVRERRALVHPDGKTVWADLSTILVRDSAGQPLRLQTMALDISEQVAGEARLASRAAQQAVLLDLAQAGLDGEVPHEFLSRAVALVARGTHAQFGTVLEKQASGTLFERVATYGLPDPLPPDDFPLDAARVGLDNLKTGLRTANAFKHRDRPDSPISKWMVDSGVTSSLVVGIFGSLGPFGMIAVHSNGPREFDADDIQFMQLASTIISVAVERKHGEQQRRMLLSRLVSAQEEERRSIAGDIHDDAVQVMTAANMRLELFRLALSDPEQLAAAEKLQETISLATGRLRTLLFQLNPPDLDRHGLAAGIQRHLEQFKIDSGIPWVLQANVDKDPPPQLRTLLFRIFQEAIANVRKHARARSVTVTVSAIDGGVLVQVTDDGVGFDLAAAQPRPGHLGLASMRERAEIAGGWWRLMSDPGVGTEVSAWVPVPTDPDGPATRAAQAMALS